MRSFQAPEPGAPLLTVEGAQESILGHVTALPAETVPFEEAAGRVLREDVLAAYDVPPHDNSAMDGYAVVASDTGSAPVSLRVTGEIAASTRALETLTPGTAVRIMTGAPVPPGATAVANVEITDGGSEIVRILKPLTEGKNIRRRGEDMRSGDVVMRAGTPLRAGDIGALATARKTSVLVGRRPRVAILATGDELAEVRDAAPDAIANSNSYVLAALVREAGGEPFLAGIVRDDREATIRAIADARSFDMIVSSGGVSVGAYDFVREALESLGADIHFWRVNMKPGKPVVFATLGSSPYFGLPGNPVSSVVSFTLFVAPAIRAAAGQTANLLPPLVMTRAAAPLKSTAERRNYLRVRVVAGDGVLHSHPMTSQGSGVTTSLVGANGLAVLEQGTKLIETGESVPVLLLGVPFS